MRLLSLNLIGQYKGLVDQTFNFERAESTILAFIGLNGSGKSQLLELLAEIFAYLERMQRSEFKARKALGFGFELIYEVEPTAVNRVTELNTYTILSDQDTKFKVELDFGLKEPTVYRLANNSWTAISISELALPYVVGYASGLNENMQRSFMKNAVQYYDVIRTRLNRRKELSQALNHEHREKINERYLRRHPHIFSESSYVEPGYFEGGYFETVNEPDTPLSNMLHVDYDSAGLLLTSMAVLPRGEIEKIYHQARFKYPSKVTLQYDLREAVFGEDAIKDIQMLIRVAGKQHISGIGPKTTDKQFEIYELDYLRGKITLDFENQSVLSNLRESNSSEPLSLFRRLYKLQQLGVKNWQGTDRQSLRKDNFFGTVKKPQKTKLPLSVEALELSDGSRSSVDFNDLSDGESQLLQVLAITRIFRDESALVLLDEPETHFNPSWRTYFYQYLDIAMTDDNYKKTSQVFISTHSPFMLSSLKKENVFKFKRNESNYIEMEPVTNQTYGSSFDVLIKEHFGLRSLISQSVIDEIREQLKQGDTEAKEWVENNLGLSAEKAYLIRKLSS